MTTRKPSEPPFKKPPWTARPSLSPPKSGHTHLHFDGVLEHCEEALRDLCTDYLDLFLIHWPNTTVPLSETLRAMDHIFDSGKARSIGVSNFPVNLLEEATQTAQSPICANQIQYNLTAPKPDVLQYCHNHNILVTAHTPLGKGGVFRNRKLAELANRYEKTAAQIALRWLTQQGIIVIPKAGSTVHMQENMDIFNWNLSEKDLVEAR